MSIGLKSDSSGTSGSIVINGSDAVLVTTTGITTASIQDSSITFSKLSTSATEADNAASRVAKAWVNFDGTTNTAGNCTIRADFNVSTVADNGTGNYTINFTSSMADVDYVITGVCSLSNAYPSYSGSRIPYISAPAGTMSTSAIQIATGAGATSTGAGDAADAAFVTVAIFR